VAALGGLEAWSRIGYLAALPWRALLAGIGVGLLLLLVISAAGFDLAYADRIHPGVRALGMDLGGLRPEEARAALSARLAAFAQEPLVFEYDDRTWETTPTALGLRLDVAALADAAYAVGRQGGPLEHLIRPAAALFGRRDLPQPPALLDEARVQRYLEDLAAAVDRPLADAQLSIDPDGRVVYVAHQTGRRLQLAATRDRLGKALMVGETLRVPLAVQETLPPVTDADLATARQQAERYLGAPVVLQLGDDSWTLSPAELVAAVELEGPKNRPTGARLKDAALEQAVRRKVQQVNRPASNARFEFAEGSLRTIRESQEGREVDFPATLALVRKAIDSGERAVQVPARITQPSVTSEQRDQLGIREQIARGETRFAGSSPPKIHNIKLAASRIHGVVIPPGAMFSFNQELGPTTLDSGYQVGWGIASTGDGSHATVPSVAGGICQVATTLLQPVFWGGYQLEERHHHLYWIPAYGMAPLGRVGLDATVDEDTGLDFRFINSSPDYVLIQAVTDDTSLSISLYGTKPSWDVKVDGPKISNRRTARTEVVRYPEPTLPWGQQFQVEAAGDGFDVVIVRTVADGSGSRTLTLKTHYEPSQNMVAVGVRGAPAGAAEQIRTANAVARTNEAARESPSSAPASSNSPRAATAPAAVATTAPTTTASGVPGGDFRATGPSTAPAAPQAPAASTRDQARVSAPSAPASADTARQSSPATSGSSGASSSAAVSPPPTQGPAVPRFSSSAPGPSAAGSTGAAARP